MRNICVRDAPCWDQTPRTCFRVECKTAFASARARTQVTNAYTKRDIENSFPCTQMFVQTRNEKMSSTAIASEETCKIMEMTHRFLSESWQRELSSIPSEKSSENRFPITVIFPTSKPKIFLVYLSTIPSDYVIASVPFLLQISDLSLTYFIVHIAFTQLALHLHHSNSFPCPVTSLTTLLQFFP